MLLSRQNKIASSIPKNAHVWELSPHGHFQPQLQHQVFEVSISRKIQYQTDKNMTLKYKLMKDWIQFWNP